MKVPMKVFKNMSTAFDKKVITPKEMIVNHEEPQLMISSKA